MFRLITHFFFFFLQPHSRPDTVTTAQSQRAKLSYSCKRERSSENANVISMPNVASCQRKTAVTFKIIFPVSCEFCWVHMVNASVCSM